MGGLRQLSFPVMGIISMAYRFAFVNLSHLFGQGLFNCLGKRRPVNITGKMDRALTINGIPSCRVG